MGSGYSKIPDPPVYKSNIKASDIPQWTWSNAQCREWLILMLVKGDKTQAKAEKEVLQFEGFGPNMWITTDQTWQSWFGVTGTAIYAILMEVRLKPGAVPVTVSIPHYNTRTKA